MPATSDPDEYRFNNQMSHTSHSRFSGLPVLQSGRLLSLLFDESELAFECITGIYH